MNTKNKSYNRPKVITEENLAIMSDEQLKKLFIDLRSSINKNRRNKNQNKEREIDFCYVQREIQLRRDTRQSRRK
jgi:hypothetical protein